MIRWGIAGVIAGLMWLGGTALASACGLDGVWEVKADNGDHGLLRILDGSDQGSSCNSSLLYYDISTNHSATENCFILNSGEITIMCEVVSTSAKTWNPESFSLQRVSATELRGRTLEKKRKVTFTKK